MYITLKFRQAKDVYNNNSLITEGGLTASFFVNKNFKPAKTVKLCYITFIFAHKTCRLRKSPYLCNVFFIVLDFKVNKGWSTAVLLFYVYTFHIYIYKMPSEHPKRFPDGISFITTKKSD